MPRLAYYALAVCALAAVAAAVSFARGSWPVGIVWVMMAGVSSNMAVFHLRRAKAGRASARPPVSR